MTDLDTPTHPIHPIIFKIASHSSVLRTCMHEPEILSVGLLKELPGECRTG
jgi:hypothetical protein